MERLFSYKKISSTICVVLLHETMVADSPRRSTTSKDSQFSIQSEDIFMAVISFFFPSNILSTASMWSLCSWYYWANPEFVLFALNACGFEIFSRLGIGDIIILHPFIAIHGLYCMKCVLICGQYHANLTPIFLHNFISLNPTLCNLCYCLDAQRLVTCIPWSFYNNSNFN